VSYSNLEKSDFCGFKLTIKNNFVHNSQTKLAEILFLRNSRIKIIQKFVINGDILEGQCCYFCEKQTAPFWPRVPKLSSRVTKCPLGNCKLLAKTFGYILGDFFANSSGRPGSQACVYLDDGLPNGLSVEGQVHVVHHGDAVGQAAARSEKMVSQKRTKTIRSTKSVKFITFWHF
jgi:hypothetical protein